jgi:transposase
MPQARLASHRVRSSGSADLFARNPAVSAFPERVPARLRFVMDQIKEIEAARLLRLEKPPAEEPHAMLRLLFRVIGVGIETANMLVHEALSRKLRDRREKGVAKAGNAQVRRGMIQLAWRFLLSRCAAFPRRTPIADMLLRGCRAGTIPLHDQSS